MSDTMRAIVMHEPGGPDVLKLERLPIPSPEPGQVLIRVEAFGLNRSELFTRQGLSPDVDLPRVLGIEAVGTVAAAPGGEFEVGTTVATVMGGMGRDFDGGYAEYTMVRAGQVQAFRTDLPWKTLGALPEMLQAAWGSLHRALRLKSGERLLIRGGTTSVGLAAAAIAKSKGAKVASTSRRPDSEPQLREAGADHFFLDDGNIADRVRAEWDEGADKVLELVGTKTLKDSLRAAREPGIVCMTGMVGNEWATKDFSPMEAIPTAVGLTTYTGGVSDFTGMPMQNLIDQVADGSLPITIGRVFAMDDIVEAHRTMEENRAHGKIVVLTRSSDRS